MSEPTASTLPATKEEYVRAFRHYLDAQGQKYTSERQEVIDVFFEQDDHLEAEDVLVLIRQKGKRVSRATIYRTISLLVEAGLLKMVSLEHRHTHYEKLLRNHDHDHLVCLQCHDVIEFSNELSEKLTTLICELNGVKPVRRHFEIIGICDPACSKRKAAAAAAGGDDDGLMVTPKLPCNQDEYLDIFRTLLRKKGLKYTQERQAIIEVLFEATDHLEAEEVLMALRQRGQQVSRATIYRTLNLLVEAGLLKTVSFEHRHTHYEVLLCNADHDHLVDLNTHRVIEFSNEMSQKLMKRICEEHHFRPIRRHFEIVAVSQEGSAASSN